MAASFPTSPDLTPDRDVRGGHPCHYPVWTDARTSGGPPLGQTDIFTNVEIAD